MKYKFHTFQAELRRPESQHLALTLSEEGLASKGSHALLPLVGEDAPGVAEGAAAAAGAARSRRPGRVVMLSGELFAPGVLVGEWTVLDTSELPGRDEAFSFAESAKELGALNQVKRAGRLISMTSHVGHVGDCLYDNRNAVFTPLCWHLGELTKYFFLFDSYVGQSAFCLGCAKKSPAQSEDALAGWLKGSHAGQHRGPEHAPGIRNFLSFVGRPAGLVLRVEGGRAEITASLRRLVLQAEYAAYWRCDELQASYRLERVQGRAATVPSAALEAIEQACRAPFSLRSTQEDVIAPTPKGLDEFWRYFLNIFRC